ncbi:MAG: glycosyltransferase [Patescibacteria group bacterium]
MRVIIFSYERDFFDAQSDASLRMRRMADDGHCMSIIVMSNDARSDREEQNIRIIGCRGSRFTRWFSAIRFAKKEVKKARKAGESPILTAQDPFTAGAAAFIVSRCMDVPYEAQEHGDHFAGFLEKKHVLWRIKAIIGGYILQRADGVRVVSERVRDRLISRFHIAPEKIITYPVDRDLSPLFSRPPRPWPETPVIVVPLRFVEQKGLDLLLEACKELRDRGIKFRLRLVGKGKVERQLRNDIDAYGLQDTVSMESWADHNELWNNADMFVLSSHYEGWGRTITEAMAAGVPVVTTDVGCVGSVLRPQVDGLVIQSGDAHAIAVAIERMFEDSDRRAWFAANARERIKTLPTSEQIIQRQHEAWDQIQQSSLAPRSSLLAPSSRRAWMITLALIIFAALIRLVSIKLFWPSLGANREWGFYTLVHQWFQGFGYTFANQLGCASAYRSPGYLFFLTAVYGLFGMDNFFVQAVIQNIFAVLIVYLIYRLGWRLTGDRRVGWIAGFLIAVYPYTFYHYTQYYHTFLSSTFLVLILLALIQLEKTRKIGYAILGGIAIACLAYVQGTILPLAPILCIWLLWRWRKNGGWKRAIGMSVLMGVIAAALIAPWTIRNWTVFHRFIPLTTDLGFGFYKANNEDIYALTKLGFPQEVVGIENVNPNNPLQIKYTMYSEAEAALRAAGGYKDMAFWTEWHPREPVARGDVSCSQLSDMSEPDVNAHWLALGMDWLKKNYVTDGMKLEALKFATFWSPALQPSLKYGAAWSFGNDGMIAMFARNSLIAYGSFAIVFLLAGIYVMIRRKKLGDIAPILIILIGYSFFHSFFAGYTKYRIPLDNLTVVLAAIALVEIWDRMRKNRS